MNPKINRTVLMSGAEYFTDDFAINSLMDSNILVDRSKAIEEHHLLQSLLEEHGVDVIKVDAPRDCQDGVYTANWGLCRGNKVILSSLPNKRKAEEPYAENVIRSQGKIVIPAPYKFSGQGDALPCGNLLFCGSNYRTDSRMHKFIEEQLGFKVIGLQTIPEIDGNNQPVINPITGWPDSFFYDIDLAIAVLSPDLIAWCPEAFTPDSQTKIRALDIDKIEVSFKEAKEGFGCNLVSTGEVVVMSAHAPNLQKQIEEKGIKTITPSITELAKGGGYIRCSTLSLDVV